MEPETFARGERTLLRIFAAVFAGALAWKLRPPADPTTPRLIAWLLVATLLIAVPLLVLVFSGDFGITASSTGVRNSSAWGVTASTWNEISGLAVGRGWLGRFERIYVIRTDGSRLPLRSLEMPRSRRAELEGLIGRIEMHRPPAP